MAMLRYCNKAHVDFDHKASNLFCWSESKAWHMVNRTKV